MLSLDTLVSIIIDIDGFYYNNQWHSFTVSFHLYEGKVMKQVSKLFAVTMLAAGSVVATQNASAWDMPWNNWNDGDWAPWNNGGWAPWNNGGWSPWNNGWGGGPWNNGYAPYYGGYAPYYGGVPYAGYPYAMPQVPAMPDAPLVETPATDVPASSN